MTPAQQQASAGEVPETGGPALPTESVYAGRHGMTLRDWFAGQALAGSDFMNCEGWSHFELAQYAYSLADAMLRARVTVAKGGE